MPWHRHPDAQLAVARVESSDSTAAQSKHVCPLRSCPSCGRPMRPWSETEIYECKACRVFVTEPS